MPPDDAPAPIASCFDPAALDVVIDGAVSAQRIVGCVVLVAHRGQIVFRRAAGWADREAGRAMAEDTPFRLASITKPIVTATALALRDAGVLSLDDPVIRWLPGFTPALADGSRPLITLHHLLTHTAGLSYSFQQRRRGSYLQAGISDGLDDPPGLGLDENVQRIASVPLLHPPGSAWQYSIAIDVLGRVLEVASGLSLPELVEQRVSAPLGLERTRFGFDRSDAGRDAVPYADAEPEPRRMAADEPVPYYWLGTARFAPGRAFNPRAYASGGSGMVGPADEVLRFLEAMRQGGGPVLGPATARSLRTHQIGALRVETLPPGWGFGYGAAVLLDPAAARSPQSAGTWHWVGIYGHSWFVDAERELSVVALTNTALAGMGGAFPDALRDAVYTGLPNRPAPPEPAPATANRD